MVFGTGVAILTSVHPPGERGRALGLNVAAVYLGLSLGPPIGGLLTDQLGWRAVFWAGTLLGIVTAIVVFARLRGEWADARGERYDSVGALIYTAAMTALMRGLTLLPTAGGIGLTAGGLAGLAAFGARAFGRPHPLLDVSLWRDNRVFAFSNLAALINYSTTFAVGFLLSLYLQYVKGMPPREAGLVLVAQPAVMALLSPLAGHWSDRIAPRLIASAGMAVIGVGLLLLTALDASTPLAAIVPLLALLGVGFALFSSPNTNAVMGSVAPRHFGVAGATLATMRLTGQALSLALAMLIFALRVGPVAITPERHGAFIGAVRLAFGLFAAMCVLGLFASLARGSSQSASSR
jgi:MFS family permease